MGLREDKKADKRERIVAAARALFAREGYESTTMRMLAREAGVAVGTLYQYAPDKVGLAEMISADDLQRAVAEALGTLPADDLHAQFMHVFGTFYDVHRADRELARVLVRELSVGTDPARAERAARFLGVFDALAALAEQAKQRGELGSDVDAYELAVAAFGLHYFLFVAWLADVGVIQEPEPVLHGQLRLLLRGLEGG